LFAALFGLGETFMAPTVSPLVNSLADDRVRGRANSLASATYSVAFVVSPALSIGMIAAGVSVAWLGLLCAGCLITVLLGVRLGRQLSPAQDRVGDDTPVLVEVVPAAAPLAEPGLAERG
jgi:MFS family permease